MTTLRDPKRDPQERAKRKRTTARSKRHLAAMMASVERLEALNVKLEALVHRGGR